MAALGLLIFILPNRRPRKESNPRCRRCGYDLTGNQSGICPECGTPIAEIVHQQEAVRLLQIEPDPEPDPRRRPLKIANCKSQIADGQYPDAANRRMDRPGRPPPGSDPPAPLKPSMLDITGREADP